MVGGHAEPSRRRFELAGVALASLPFLAVEFVPSTDLPQHVAQIRLLSELWGFERPSVELDLLDARPFAANTLVYLPMFALARLVEPRLVGKLTVLSLVLLSVLMLHRLAAARGREPSHAMVAALLLFSAPLYWGFLNFLGGLPLFLLYLVRLSQPDEEVARPRALALEALLLLLLYWAHVFWIPAALIASVLLDRGALAPKRLAARALCFVPVALAIALWLPKLVAARRASGFSLATYYLVPLSERASFSFLAGALFGGVRGLFEPLFTLLVLAYAFITCVRARRSSRASPDGRLLALGSLVLAFGLLAPDQTMNTILVNRRFVPVAALLLLLALPAHASRVVSAAASTGVAVFALWTTFTWALFEQLELQGLSQSVAQIPPGSSVLGLDYRQESPYVRDRPFLQLAAYAQAEHGGELNFSFAEHASSVVVYRKPRRSSFTPGIEWRPERATLRDLGQFDCALVIGDEPEHERFRNWSGRSSPVTEGPVRSYCRRP